MKLLNVIASMDPASGGPCQGIRNLATRDKKLGIYREVVCMDDPNADFLHKDDFVIHALGPSISSWQYAPRLFAWLKENLPLFDVVIVNGIWLYHTYAVRKAVLQLSSYNNTKRSSEIPLVFIMPHGMLDPYFQLTATRKLKAFRNRLYWKYIEEKNIRKASGLLFTCQMELELAKTTFSPYKPKRQLNVSYGVQAVPAYTAAMKNSFIKTCQGLGDTPYLLFLGRIHEKKGVDLLVKAYITIFTSMPPEEIDFNFPKLVIAGPGMETIYGRELTALVLRTPGIANRVYFPGMLTGDAKAGALWGSEAFVLPSHQENFGIAVAEALSCSKAVLISDKINIYEEIQNAHAGFISADTLEGTINNLTQWLKTGKHEKDIMRQNAGGCFLSNFSIEKAANKLFDSVSLKSN